MLKKTSARWVKIFCLFSFALIISAALILGAGVTPVFAAKKADAQKSIGPVDINSATQKELEDIKGVGPATAKKIIAGRPYKSVDELSKAGISAKAIDSMKPFVKVGSATAAPAAAATKVKAAKTAVGATETTASSEVPKTAKTAKSTAAKLTPGTKININTADQAAIEKLPEIGPVKAKAIIDGRPYNSIEDVMKVKGIKGKTFEAIKDYIIVR